MAMLPLAQQPFLQELTDAISFLITTQETVDEAQAEVVRRASWEDVIKKIKNEISDIQGFHILTGTEFEQLFGNLEAGHLYFITEQNPEDDMLSPGTMWLAEDDKNFTLLINLPLVNAHIRTALNITQVAFTKYEDGTIKCSKTYDEIISMISGSRQTVIAYCLKENGRENSLYWDKEQTSRYENYPDDKYIEFRFEEFTISVNEPGVTLYQSAANNNQRAIIDIQNQLAGLEDAMDATIALQQQILADAASVAE